MSDEVARRDVGHDVGHESHDVVRSLDVMLLPSSRQRIAHEIDRAKRRIEQLNTLSKIRKPTMHVEVKIAEAPVDASKMADMGGDVLGFLAQYCIIEKDRLALYEDVFLSTIEESDNNDIITNTQRSTSVENISQGRQLVTEIDRPESKIVTDDPEIDENPQISREKSANRDTSMGESHDVTVMGESRNDVMTPVMTIPDVSHKRVTLKTRPQITDEELSRCEDMSVLGRVPGISNSSVSAGREYLERLNCSLNLMMEREEQLKLSRDLLQRQKFCYIVDKALLDYPDHFAKFHTIRYHELLSIHHYKTTPDNSEQVVDIPLRTQPDIQRRDEGIYKLLDQRILDEICKQCTTIHSLDVHIERLGEKLDGVETRLEQILNERSMMRMYCDVSEKNDVMSHNNGEPSASSRDESPVNRTLHPDVDRQISTNDMLPALRQINRNLITDNELAFINHVLDLPGQRPLNFHLFSVVAALSEKVVNSDRYVRDLIQGTDCENLLTKLDTCKNLFLMLTNGDCIPEGSVSSSNLKLDLLAGGLNHKNVIHVVRKLTRTAPGIVDFLDFVTYIPLFIEVHRHIVDDPLTTSHGDTMES